MEKSIIDHVLPFKVTQLRGACNVKPMSHFGHQEEEKVVSGDSSKKLGFCKIF